MTEDEQRIAREEALGRQRAVTGRGAVQGYRKRDQASQIAYEVMAASGEYCCARLLGLEWTGQGEGWRQGGEDVCGHGLKIEVKTTDKSSHRLAVRCFDIDDRPDRQEEPYVLMIGKDGVYKAVGWLWGKEIPALGTIEQYAGFPRSYFVKRSDLRSMNELEEIVKHRMRMQIELW